MAIKIKNKRIIADKCGVELDFPTLVNTIAILFSAY